MTLISHKWHERMLAPPFCKKKAPKKIFHAARHRCARMSRLLGPSRLNPDRVLLLPARLSLFISKQPANPHCLQCCILICYTECLIHFISQPSAMVPLEREHEHISTNHRSHLQALTSCFTAISCVGSDFGAVNLNAVVCSDTAWQKKASACLSLSLSPTCSAVEPGCLLSAVVFHHVHSPFWHA